MRRAGSEKYYSSYGKDRKGKITFGSSNNDKSKKRECTQEWVCLQFIPRFLTVLTVIGQSD